MKRRTILIWALAALASGCQGSGRGVVLNDVHSKLNPTRVDRVLSPRSEEEVIRAVKRAKREGKAISISGGKHAMGGQQFGEGTIHLSMSKMNDVLAFNRQKGIVRVEAGVQWPKLIDYLIKEQEGEWPQWGIAQKQTGADRLSLGGALSANIHGRGVRFKPIIQDVESFTLVNAEGELLTVSRSENKELFGLVIGGYGLFGVIATIDLRLIPRTKVQRVVEVVSVIDLPKKAKQRIEDGFLFGDFQYKTDSRASDFMQVGVFSTYKPVPKDTPIPEQQKTLTSDKWNKLIGLAHADKGKAFDFYSRYYLGTNGQVYWSDTHQMSYYDDGYEEYVKAVMPAYTTGSLMITEANVPIDKIQEFLRRVADDSRKHDVNIIYGTVRLIQKDDESFLPWAKQDFACVIFNLRVEHSDAGRRKARADFRRIIDRALEFGGTYFLTYHRWARKEQTVKAYPEFSEFLKLKRKYDPQERFQSEWYRHYREMFSAELSESAR